MNVKKGYIHLIVYQGIAC